MCLPATKTILTNSTLEDGAFSADLRQRHINSQIGGVLPLKLPRSSRVTQQRASERWAVCPMWTLLYAQRKAGQLNKTKVPLNLDAFHWFGLLPLKSFLCALFFYGYDHFLPDQTTCTCTHSFWLTVRDLDCVSWPVSGSIFFFFLPLFKFSLLRLNWTKLNDKPSHRTTFFQDAGLALWFACAGKMKFTPEPQLLTHVESFSCSLKRWLLSLWCAPILKLQFCFVGNSSKVTIWLSL